METLRCVKRDQYRITNTTTLDIEQNFRGIAFMFWFLVCKVFY